MNIVNPVDTILLKSILQRGAEKGKHDVEDIKAILEHVELDLNYLKKRLLEANALEYTTPLFEKLGVPLTKG